VIKVFRDRLKKVMADQNINQVELSRICSVSRSTVSKWMSGDSEPTKERKNEIAAILNLQENFFEEIVIPVEKIETLSVKEVAKLMGLSVPTIEKGLIQEKFPWGYAIQTSENKHRYFINAKKFFATEMISV
jgi:transcriptional regulator with XRE-family HTH domain